MVYTNGRMMQNQAAKQLPAEKTGNCLAAGREKGKGMCLIVGQNQTSRPAGIFSAEFSAR